MQGALNSAGLFLINTLLDLYLFVLAIRIILLWTRASFFNPFSQFIIKLTNPIITPLRRFIPNLAGIELASVLLIILLEVLKFFLLAMLAIGPPKLAGLLLLASADTLKVILNTFFYAILAQAILSWVQATHSPIGETLAHLTRPVLRPFQRLIPPIGGFDISPIPAMLCLQLLIIVLVNPLLALGTTLSFGSP